MIRLTLKDEPPLRLSAEGLLPEQLAGRSPREVEKLPLAAGRRAGAVGDWFRVAAGAGDALEIEGPCRRIDRIGAGMTRGSIHLRGDAGAYLGLGMRGGSITLDGSAGFGAATDLRGGMLRIAGNAGDGLGGALPGSAAGMRDGIVIVGGNAGDGAGAKLRRGLVVVGGTTGAACGAQMIAGTIVVGGALGPYAGAAMQRGSLLALGGAARLGSGFVDCGVHDLVFFRLLARHLASLNLDALARRIGPLRRFAGDDAVSGKGELLVAP
jgi:formylmethanofuran dehydrogenase subunit C